MRKPDTYLDEIREIRDRIDTETASMTAEERTAYFNQCGTELSRIYGFKIIHSVSSRDKIETPAE